MGALVIPIATDKQVTDAYLLLVNRFEQWQRCQPTRFQKEFSTFEAQLANTQERFRTWQGYCQARDRYHQTAIAWCSQAALRGKPWSHKTECLNEVIQAAFKRR